MGRGVRTPATTSSPCALIRYSPYSFLSPAGVAREGHAAARVLTHVAEDHRLDIDGGPQIVVDLVQIAVDDGPVVVPRAKHRLNGQKKLPRHVFRKIFFDFLTIQRLALIDDGKQRLDAEPLDPA